MNIPKPVHSFVKFQLIPLPIVGAIFSILGLLLHLEWVYFSFDIFSLLYDPLFMAFLGIGSFLYIDQFYMKKFTCKCHRGYRKNIHYISGYVTGMMAAFVFYLIPVAALFFVVYDSESNTSALPQNIGFDFIEIPLFVALGIFGFISRLIVREVFTSLSEDSSTLFHPHKTILQRIREHYIEIKNYVIELKKKLGQLSGLYPQYHISK